MAKTHEGDCIDIDPFIPTGQCSICTNTPQDTIIPEDRPASIADIPAPVVDPDPTPEEL